MPKGKFNNPIERAKKISDKAKKGSFFNCIICGNRFWRKPFAIFPELRFNIDNGITLCKKCHDKEPKGKEIFCIK